MRFLVFKKFLIKTSYPNFVGLCSVLAMHEILYCFAQTNQGIKNLSGAEADRLAASDPDYATRDLYNAIADGNYPSWTTYIQVMTFEEAEKFRWNPFDLTKVIIAYFGLNLVRYCAALWQEMNDKEIF